MEDFEDDTHFCLKCHNTIIGLENYVSHRKNNCLKQVVDHQKSPLPCQLLTADESFTLKADDFFSSLELQSSSKKLIQTSNSGKSSSGILTRSKATAFAREGPEPSKSGKNAWIGGHQLKQLDYDDNQSKLIKAVANLERRKEEIGRNKDIQRIQVYEESEDDSEDSDYDDETSDEDAPPRNHTGGKWKPSSPIYWKSSQLDGDGRTPPPTFTGGKWKPTSTKRNISPLLNETKGKWKSEHLHSRDNEDIPPPTFTGSKWSQSKKQDYSLSSSDTTKGRCKSRFENSTKWNDEYPPPEHTKGKWKPEASPDLIPATFTKGKWMPSDTVPAETSSKEMYPTYTKGKWLPSSKCSGKEPYLKLSEDSPLRKSGGTVQYWCKPCDRRLASKVVYERHLKSEFHFKRILRDNELEDNLNFMKNERRVKRRAVEIVKKTETDDVKKMKTRRRTFANCQVCNSRVNINLMGKHLISHYHCRKGDLTSESSQQMVLDYIANIIQQSPFQCKICRFFFNTHKDFLHHWNSDSHLITVEKKPGHFLCSYCKFSCETNELMFKHLTSKVHSEVVSAINRSVPISIKKVNFNQCGTCNEKFLLNIQLNKHIQMSGHNTYDNTEKNDYKCKICSHMFISGISLQRHNKNIHKVKSFICGTCKLTFTSAKEVKAHRNSEQHYYANLKKNASDKKVLEKQCQFCSETFENFLKLKEHIKVSHVEFHSRCLQCGMTFTVSQELSVHLRTKSCKYEKQPPKKHICSQCSFASDSLSQVLFHEALHGEPALMYPEKSYQISDKKPTPHYKCPKCTKFFPKSSLEYHLRTHTKERPYTCSHCKATFVRKNNWRFHEKKHTSEKGSNKAKIPKETGRPFLCSTCGASFRKRFILQQHMKIHTGKHYKCVESGCFFAGRSFGELKIHYQTHFDDRNFKCKSCDYKGKTKQQLARHATIHEAVKKFKCPRCPFSSRSAHHLKRHSRLHTGCKPYSCPHCIYKCNSLENLRKHILSTNKHPGKSLYGCKFCTEKHFQSNFFKEFKAHLMTMHSEEMDRTGKIENSTGVYEADNDSFFSFGNSHRPVEASEPCHDLQGELEVDQPAEINSDTQPLTPPLISTIPEIHSSEGADVLQQKPLRISKHEDICHQSDSENWSLVGCYDVGESGALVPLTKDDNEDVLF